MIHTSCLLKIFARAAVSAVGLLLNPTGPLAATTFTSVAAGDMSADDAILWTRTIDTNLSACAWACREVARHVIVTFRTLPVVVTFVMRAVAGGGDLGAIVVVVVVGVVAVAVVVGGGSGAADTTVSAICAPQPEAAELFVESPL